MGMQRREPRSISVWLVLGAALYWASIAVRWLPSGLETGWSDGLNGGIQLLLLAVFLLAGYAVMLRMSLSSVRLVFGGIALVVSLALVPAKAGVLTLPLWLDAALATVDFFGVAMFMLLWGLAFASVDKFRAAENVIATVLGTAALILVVLLLPKSVQYASSGLLAAASAAVMLSGQVFMVNRIRRRVPAPKALAVFMCQRAAFGATLGFLSAGHVTFSGHADVATVLFCLAALGVCGAVVLGASELYSKAPALLLLVCALLVAPFVDYGRAGLLAVATVVIWVAWSALSAVQLSEFKEVCGLGELRTCLIDKVAFAVSVFLGWLLCVALEHVLGAVAVSAGVTAERAGATGAGALEGCLPFVALAVVLSLTAVSAFAISSLVGLRKEDEMRLRSREAKATSRERVYEELAEEYRLSPREREILTLLAEGYTSSYINASLGVSNGTIKAHTAHIYQKLGVHRKDELLDLVSSR